MKVKVRGIYSTALTKLLLDNCFEIVQPSLTIKKRFELEENSVPPDLKIKDRYYLQGIRVLGTCDPLRTFQYILHSAFEDALTRKWRVSVDGIYKGTVIESDEDTVYVDIGNGVIGRLPKSEIVNINEKQMRVQVERKRIGAKQPVLTTNLKIVGNYAILVQNSRVGVSFKIRDLDKRAELYALGKKLAPDGWGIIWRGSSENESRKTLEKEITALIEKIKFLNEKAPCVEAPALLLEGLYFMDVEFPWFSKRNLDKLRASVAQTLDGHHLYKSCGGKVSAALEMAEKLLEKGRDRSEVEELFKQQIVYEFPEAGSLVDVEHVKLSGLVLHLGQATIESLDDEQISYSRIMRSDGFYDGLSVRKEARDKAVSKTKRGEWFITTKYFSKDGRWKGTYINLNTPAEVYPKTIRYVDLEVDVCIRPDGTAEILDMEKLEKASENGFISKTLFEIVKEKVKEITEVNVVQPTELDRSEMENISHKKMVQEYYSKRAKDYDWQKVRTWKSRQGFGAEVLNEVISALTSLESKPVLEVGVGSGRIGFHLLDKVRPWFVGLDLSREMLELARARMSPHKEKFDLILGDAGHLPFTNNVFNAIICVSTMHYFAFPQRSLIEFSRTLKGKGVLVYGDVTMHELDNQSFLDTLEKMLSKAHVRYCTPSQMKELLENHGFSVSKMKVVRYRKSYLSLMEDKGGYFDVKLEALHECIRDATKGERKLYSLDSNGLTLFYTLIETLKESES